MKTRFEPTHVTSTDGTPTWPEPDGSQIVGPALPANLPVAVLEQRDGWTHVQCSNHWQAWVDAEALVALEPLTTLEQRPPVKIGRVTLSIPLFAGLGIVLSSILAWFDSVPLQLERSAYAFPIGLLTDDKAFLPDQGFVSSPGGLSIGFALLILGLAAVGLSQTTMHPMIGRVIGWVVLVIATLFATQLQRGLGQLVVARALSVVGPGAYIAALSGLVLGLARGPSRLAGGAQP